MGPTTPLPADGTVRVAFDRFLLPLSVTRQSFQVQDAEGELLQSPIITYDPVSRVVSIANASPDPRAWLSAGLTYRLVIGVPRSEDDATGPRALDQSTLDPSGGPYVLAFRADPPQVPDAGGFPRVNVLPPDFCAEVLPLFRRSCAGGSCHGTLATAPDASLPAMGLVLTTAAGVAASARNVLAAETSSGARGVPSPPGTRFGVDMPRIAPGSPGNSMLLYKALLGASSGPLAPLTFDPDLDPLTAPVSADESGRLADLVPGAPMPYPGAGRLPLTATELAMVSRWIAAGGATPEGCDPR